MTERAEVLVHGAASSTGLRVCDSLREQGVPFEASRPEASGDDLEGRRIVAACGEVSSETGERLLALAARTGVHYISAPSAPSAVARTFAMYGDVAHASGSCVVPAMGYGGGLADWLVGLATDRLGGEVLGVAVCYVDEAYPRAPIGRERRRFAVTDEKGAFCEKMARLVVGPEAALLGSHVEAQTIRTFHEPPLRRRFDAARSWLTRRRRAPEEGAGAFEIIVEASRGGVSALARARGEDAESVTAAMVAFAITEALAGRVRAKGVVAPSVAFDSKAGLAMLEKRGAHITMTERSREV